MTPEHRPPEYVLHDMGGTGDGQPSEVGAYLTVDGELRPFTRSAYSLLGHPATYAYGDTYQMPAWSSSNPVGIQIPGENSR